MKHRRAVTALRVVGFLLLAALLAVAFMRCSAVIESMQARDRNAARFDAAETALNALVELEKQALYSYQRYDAKDALVYAALSDLAKNEGDEVLRSFGDGCVVRVEEDGVVLPEDYALPVTLRSQDFRDGDMAMDYGVIMIDPENLEAGTYQYRRVFDNYYCLYSQSTQFLEYIQYLDGFIADIEAAFNGYILLFYEDEGVHPIYYVSDQLVPADPSDEKSGELQTLEDLGILPDERGAYPDTVVIDGRTFDCASSFSQDKNSFEFQLLLLTSTERVNSGMATRFAIIMAVALIIMSSAAVWVSAARHRVQDEAVRKAELRRYAPRRVRRVALCIGLTGVIALGLTSMFVDALLNLYNATTNNITSLQMLEQMIDRSQSNEEMVRHFREEAYIDYAGTIADILTTFPQLQTREMLGRLSDVIQADYLMIYDRNGNQRLSDSRFIGLSLSWEEGASTHEFRKLLSGTESIAHSACTDERTGLNREMIGVSMGDVDAGYEALLVAIEPDGDETETSVDQLMLLATTSENLSFSADPVSGDIAASNFGELRGKNALALGMDPNCLKDDMTDFIYLGSVQWYAQSDMKDGMLYYYGTRVSGLFSGQFRHAAVFGGMFAVVYALLMVLLMGDYTGKSLAGCAERMIENEAPRPVHPRTPGILPWPLRLWWLKKTPEEKALFVFRTELGIGILALILTMKLMVLRKRDFELLSFIMNGQWRPGFNLFALTKIVVMGTGAALLIMLLRVFSSLIVNMLERRARTLVRFGFSLVEYVIILVLIYLSLTYLGLDITGVMTTLAGMTLAITLLAKDIISDMLGGVSNALSNRYQIGDLIEVTDGFTPFRGWVQDISISNTLLIDEQGNVKTMANRDVRNVLNLSRGGMQYVMNPTICSDLPLEEIEEILQRELPAIGAGIPDVVSGPMYKGVIAIGNGGVTLEISTECRERSYGRVRAAVNREVYRLLQTNGIQVR